MELENLKSVKGSFADHLDNGLQRAVDNLAALRDSVEVKRQVLTAIDLIVDSYVAGGSLYACGNGGSAADAQHFVAELVSKLNKDRTPIKAMSFTTDTSILTAIGNDYGYDLLFHRQVQAQMGPKDVLFALTTSGKSPNILKALEACREIGATSILLSGRDGGPAKALATHSIIVPGANTANIQECHLVLYHSICYLLELALIEKGLCSYR